MYKLIQEQSQMEGILTELMKYDAWGFDTETTGLSAHHDKVIAVQLGRPEGGYIFDTRKVNIEPLRVFFEDEKIKKIGHNLKFDYKMMKGSFGIDVEGLRCTYLAEKVLNAGRKYRGFGLEDVVLQELGVQLDKTAQKSFIGHKGAFTPVQIAYMADDVKYLLPLYKEKTKQLMNDGIANVFLIETGAIPAFGDMEYAGMILDTVNWKKVMDDNIIKRAELKVKMDEIASQYMGFDLFGEAAINYDSPEQVLKLFQLMRIKVPVMDRDGNKSFIPIQNTNKQSMKGIRHIEIVKLIEAYRSYGVRINTFGQPYIDAVDPKTGAIHPDLWQIGTETGRPAAGDSAVNPLNVPSDNRYRHCFIGGPDEVVESDDYSGCESRILAHISGDPILQKIFLDDKDIHCEVASMMYGVPVTKDNENKKYRKPAKALNFGWSVT